MGSQLGVYLRGQIPGVKVVKTLRLEVEDDVKPLVSESGARKKAITQLELDPLPLVNSIRQIRPKKIVILALSNSRN